MKRRHFLQGAGIGLASAALAAPAIAQSAPPLRWRLATTFPTNLDTLYGACEMFSKAVAELSDQKFLIQVFGPVARSCLRFRSSMRCPTTRSRWATQAPIITSAR